MYKRKQTIDKNEKYQRLKTTKKVTQKKINTKNKQNVQKFQIYEIESSSQASYRIKIGWYRNIRIKMQNTILQKRREKYKRNQKKRWRKTREKYQMAARKLAHRKKKRKMNVRAGYTESCVGQ